MDSWGGKFGCSYQYSQYFDLAFLLIRRYTTDIVTATYEDRLWGWVPYSVCNSKKILKEGEEEQQINWPSSGHL